MAGRRDIRARFRREARNEHAGGADFNGDAMPACNLNFANAQEARTGGRAYELLVALDSYSDGRGAVIVALTDDNLPSPFSSLADDGQPFASAAGTRQIFERCMPLLGTDRRPDRELRDYWIRPLVDLGLVERVYVTPKEGVDAGEPLIQVGVHYTKSARNAYRLDPEVRNLLDSPANEFDELLAGFVQGNAQRRMRALQARTASLPSTHGALIIGAVGLLQETRLGQYLLLYVDDEDDARVENEWKPRLATFGLELTLADKFPDAILGHPETHGLWVVDAVVSDGEVDIDRRDAISEWAERQGCRVEGFVTAYRTWRDAARRQGAHKNIAPNTYMWIAEDAGKLWAAELLEASGD